MSGLDRSLIAALPLFSEMSTPALDDILTQATSKRYPAGQAVFEQGAGAAHFFVLLNGRLRVTQVTPDGQQVAIRMVNPGDLFGIAPAIGRTHYPGTATAVIESLALLWPVNQWGPLVARHPALAVNAMQTMGQRLIDAQQRIREMSTEAVERRVAHAVLRLANQAGQREAGGVRIDFPISKQDIAELTGTTLHTVSRILTAWEEEGLVEGGRQKLLIREPHQLLLIADGLRPALL